MQQPHMEEEMEIDLKELFFELLAHWKMIVLSAILTGVIAMLVNIFLITPKYSPLTDYMCLRRAARRQVFLIYRQDRT